MSPIELPRRHDEVTDLRDWHRAAADLIDTGGLSAGTLQALDHRLGRTLVPPARAELHGWPHSGAVGVTVVVGGAGYRFDGSTLHLILVIRPWPRSRSSTRSSRHGLGPDAGAGARGERLSLSAQVAALDSHNDRSGQTTCR